MGGPGVDRAQAPEGCPPLLGTLVPLPNRSPAPPVPPARLPCFQLHFFSLLLGPQTAIGSREERVGWEEAAAFRPLPDFSTKGTQRQPKPAVPFVIKALALACVCWWRNVPGCCGPGHTQAWVPFPLRNAPGHHPFSERAWTTCPLPRPGRTATWPPRPVGAGTVAGGGAPHRPAGRRPRAERQTR